MVVDDDLRQARRERAEAIADVEERTWRWILAACLLTALPLTPGAMLGLVGLLLAAGEVPNPAMLAALVWLLLYGGLMTTAALLFSASLRGPETWPRRQLGWWVLASGPGLRRKLGLPDVGRLPVSEANPFAAPPSDTAAVEPPPPLTSLERRALDYVHGTAAPKVVFGLAYGLIALITVGLGVFELTVEGLTTAAAMRMGAAAISGLSSLAALASGLLAFRAHEGNPDGVIGALDTEQLFWQVIVFSIALLYLTCGAALGIALFGVG